MRKKAFGTYKIAGICHVTPATIGRWIDENKFPFFTTAGGHRRVWASDLAAFLKSHNIPLPDDLRGYLRLRFLIVDDEPAIRRLLSRVLRGAYPDAEIHEADDGFEAGDKVRQVLPSLVLLDLRLPGLDGVKVCKKIRRNKDFRRVKILAVSGNATNESKKNILKAGADDFLEKPIDADLLLAKVSKLLA